MYETLVYVYVCVSTVQQVKLTLPLRREKPAGQSGDIEIELDDLHIALSDVVRVTTDGPEGSPEPVTSNHSQAVTSLNSANNADSLVPTVDLLGISSTGDSSSQLGGTSNQPRGTSSQPVGSASGTSQPSPQQSRKNSPRSSRGNVSAGPTVQMLAAAKSGRRLGPTANTTTPTTTTATTTAGTGPQRSASATTAATTSAGTTQRSHSTVQPSVAQPSPSTGQTSSTGATGADRQQQAGSSGERGGVLALDTFFTLSLAQVKIKFIFTVDYMIAKLTRHLCISRETKCLSNSSFLFLVALNFFGGGVKK